ncbi:hypothetical protein ABZZ79_06805 [Streptomyces sp. NPDC006458]|uniref:hypothetical protein n=1 Tax=Streptomyces sp. NPDC006458 TaxID=3154302 RepID=UPI0033A7948F
MAEHNAETNGKSATKRNASNARGAASNGSTSAGGAADKGSSAAGAAKKGSAPAARAANKAAATTDDTVRSEEFGTGRVAGVASTAARTAAQGVETGRRALVTASGQCAVVARTAWTVVGHHKLITVGVGAGAAALSGASYVLGRRAGLHAQSPVSRLTHRIWPSAGKR